MRAPDATPVAGADLQREVVLRKGEVVGERYQILENLAIDAFAGTYRAFDQETEAEVRLRLVHADLLPDEPSRRRLLERLEAVLGKGGRYLSPLLDADRDGPRVYAIEPAPAGTSLRKIFDRRFAEGRSFRSDEVLPIVARLAAALEALPAGFRHGEVRPARIWVKPNGLSLIGGFLVSALPESAVAAALQNEAHRAQHAPELGHSGPSPTTDLYGIALVALEALIGSVPENPSDAIPASLGGVGDALASLLVANPAERATSLSALLAALARQSDKPIPVLDVGAYRSSAARATLPFPGDPSNPMVIPTRLNPSPPPGYASASNDGLESEQVDRNATRRITYPWLDPSVTIFDEETPVRTSPEAWTPPPSSSAAPPFQQTRETPGSLDALGIDEVVNTIDGANGEGEDGLIHTPPHRSGAMQPFPRRPTSPTPAPAPDDVHSLEGVKPIPRPKPIESILPPPPMDGDLVLFDDSHPDDPIPRAAPRERPGPRPAPEARRVGNMIVTDRPRARRAAIGRQIVLISLLAAAVIIAGSLLYATYRRSAADHEREQRLQQRYEELMRQNAGEPEGAAGVDD